MRGYIEKQYAHLSWSPIVLTQNEIKQNKILEKKNLKKQVKIIILL